MMRRFQIIVEGDADKKFFEDYYHHIFGEKAPKDSITHPGKDGDTGGYQKLKSEDVIGAMRQNTDLGGINLVIFDADEDAEARRKELLAIKDAYDVDFKLFLLPNDKDAGALEDLLEQIINHAYLGTLLGKSRSQKKLIKDANRNYENSQHWNLDAEYLEPLREFLLNQLK